MNEERKTYIPHELLYAAINRCICGVGLAYPLDSKEALELRAWVCSDVLLGKVLASGHSHLDFALWKIREETSINNQNGSSTRPPETKALTVGVATCKACEHAWESEPYSACGKNHHWHGGPCPSCGNEVGSNGTYCHEDGPRVEVRYHTKVFPSEQTT